MAYYSKRHYQLVSPKADTQERFAERERNRKASEQVTAEREARFPVLTAENAAEVIAWQEARLKELLK
jgi:hypothetical protein